MAQEYKNMAEGREGKRKILRPTRMLVYLLTLSLAIITVNLHVALPFTTYTDQRTFIAVSSSISGFHRFKIIHGHLSVAMTSITGTLLRAANAPVD